MISEGGMQALEWVLIANGGYQHFVDDSPFVDPSPFVDATLKGFDGVDGQERIPFVRSAVVIGCGSAHTAWQIAISETQRQAIYADPKWNKGDIDFR